MKSKLAVLAALVALASTSFATVTLTFNTPFSQTGGVAGGFADFDGNVSNGLIWGIIIDSDNTGFFTDYDPLMLQADTTTVLSRMGMSTTNVLITSDTVTSSLTGQFEFSATNVPENFGGDGGIGGISNIAVDGTNGVNTNDKFRLVWFDPTGNSGGFIDSASFLLPPDTNATDYSAIFRGPDSPKAATGITLVPEPSSLLLSLLGFAALLRRKR